MDLQIQLDRMNRVVEQCRSALVSLRGGQLGREAYEELLEHQRAVHQEWEAKNQEYLRLDH